MVKMVDHTMVKMVVGTTIVKRYVAVEVKYPRLLRVPVLKDYVTIVDDLKSQYGCVIPMSVIV